MIHDAIHLTIDFRSPLPLFEQVTEQIRRLILSGTLKSGDQLPSIRQLSVQLTINPNTVAKIYRELEREGFLQSRQGKGCFVSIESPEILQKERRYVMRTEVRSFLNKANALGFSIDETLAFIREVKDE